MPGRIISVEVGDGGRVARGDKLLVLEAMRMEQVIVAPFARVVVKLPAKAGAQVSEGMLLARVEPEEG